MKGTLRAGIKQGFDNSNLFATRDMQFGATQAETSFTVCECRSEEFDNQCCLVVESDEISNTVIIIGCIAVMLALVALVSAFVLCISAKN